MPDTLFTQPPHWEWLIVLYFFLGGIAAGAYAIAVIVDFVGSAEDRAVARVGYLVAFPLVVISAALLSADLGQPLRFWHMLIASQTGGVMFKYWSPMSIGSWALLLFGAFSFISFLGEIGVRPLAALPRRGPLGMLFGALGALFGLFIAGYTGVLLAVTNQPVWADSQLLGALFLASAASTAVAVLLLIVEQRHAGHGLLARLETADNWIMAIELVVIVAFLATLGSLTGRFLLSAWGALIIFGVAVLGNIAPMVIHWRGRTASLQTASYGAALALLGGFLLRFAIIMGGQSL
ncbi:MAG TPA: NrfD/PsrC family molybdoenzyme membrane anchor subunit [Chloroflexota bacterium]|nr:NrfD/PsrC family molybdoenzyme membrane anchor subunit [Chloroflexota bacterium]